jgi:isopropylmalate/homocitrate/citramalate synthase
LPRIQQQDVDALRHELIASKEEFDQAQAAVYRYAQDHGISFGRMEAFGSEDSEALVRIMHEAEAVHADVCRRMKEAMWYLKHPATPFTP